MTIHIRIHDQLGLTHTVLIYIQSRHTLDQLSYHIVHIIPCMDPQTTHACTCMQDEALLEEVMTEQVLRAVKALVRSCVHITQ